jgi:hypothetical protein
MVPIYAITSFLSLVFYQKTVYLHLLRNCYEAYVVASFFTLLCHYVAPNLHDQKEYFRNVQPKLWIFPFTRVKPPRSGLTWFNLVYIGIFQFSVTRPLFTIVAAVLEAQDRYCSSSLRPEDGHLWIVLLEGTSIIIAMYFLVQFYTQLKEDIAPHKAFLKLLCIKLVMFLCFWQTWLFGFLARSDGPWKPTASVAALDIHVGIPCIAICCEMTVLACIYHWAFSWKPYDLNNHLRGPRRPESYAHSPHDAILDALNPWDYIKAAARGFRWLLLGIQHRKDDSSYQIKSPLEINPGHEPKVKPAGLSQGSASARNIPSFSGDMKKRYDRFDRANSHRHTVG